MRTSLLFFLLVSAFSSSALALPPALVCRYGNRMLPPDVSSAFKAGYDVPASEIDRLFPETEIRARWENFFVDRASTAPAQGPDRDWQTLAEFNFRAVSLWKRLLDCASGNPEQARALYADKKAISSKCDTPLSRELSEYRAQVQQYLMTSQVIDPRASTNSTRDWYRPAREPEYFPAVHPLFVQVLMENVVAAVRYPKLDDPYGEGRNDGYSDSYVFGQMMRFIQGRASQAALEAIPSMKDAPPSAFNEARLVLNGLLLLESIPSRDCSEWGLWPGVSAGIVESLRNSYTATALNVDSSLDGYYVTSPIDAIRDRYHASCGDLNDYASASCSLPAGTILPKKYVVHSMHGREYVKAFRR